MNDPFYTIAMTVLGLCLIYLIAKIIRPSRPKEDGGTQEPPGYIPLIDSEKMEIGVTVADTCEDTEMFTDHGFFFLDVYQGKSMKRLHRLKISTAFRSAIGVSLHDPEAMTLAKCEYWQRRGKAAEAILNAPAGIPIIKRRRLEKWLKIKKEEA